jgi:hypothetical protein
MSASKAGILTRARFNDRNGERQERSNGIESRFREINQQL